MSAVEVTPKLVYEGDGHSMIFTVLYIYIFRCLLISSFFILPLKIHPAHEINDPELQSFIYEAFLKGILPQTSQLVAN